MKIISLYVQSFGKLQRVPVDFKSGVNVFRYNNGHGKTTLASFIRAMLYGFKYTRTKRENQTITDASVWMTWNTTEKIGGNMVVEHNGETYKIERFFGLTQKQESLSVVNTKTQRPLDVSAGVGEYFLGLTAESYDRSAYYPQESVEISSNENLNTRLAGLVQDAQGDLDKVQDKLRNYKKSIKYERGNGGEIYRLETDKHNLLRQIEERKRAGMRQKEIDARLAAISTEQQNIEKKTAETNSRIASLQKKLAATSPTDTQLQTRKHVAELQSKLQRMGDFEQDKKRCDALAEQIAKTPDAATVQRPVSKFMRWFGIALLVSGALLALMGALGLALDLFHPMSAIVGLVLGVMALISGGVLMALSGRVKPGIITLQAGEKDQLITDYFNIVGKYVYCERMDYDQVRKLLADMYVEYMGDKRELESLLKTLTPISPENNGLQEEIDALQQSRTQMQKDALNLSAEGGMLNKEREGLQTDFVDLQEKVQEIDQQIQRANHRYSIADTVSQLLYRANENLATSYLPDLCAETQKLLSAVTSENYQLVMDQNFGVKVVVNGAERHLDDFSRGIREITLLCFRLAISRLLFGGEIPLLIVDDAFVNFDEQNFSRATQILRDLTGTQVVYFTCHDRIGNLK